MMYEIWFLASSVCNAKVEGKEAAQIVWDTLSQHYEMRSTRPQIETGGILPSAINDGSEEIKMEA